MKLVLDRVPEIHKDATEKKTEIPVVELGTGATVHSGSMRIPYTVIDVKRKGRQLILQQDDSDMDELGYGENIRPNPNGATVKANLTKSGNFRVSSYQFVTLGNRSAFIDIWR